MESSKDWAARVKAEIEAERAAKTLEQLAAEEAEYQAWLASLPVLPEHPLKDGEVEVIFLRRKPKPEGTQPPGGECDHTSKTAAD